MDWQIFINIGAGAFISVIGWFAKNIWDALHDLKNSLHQIEIDLPTHYARKEEITARFDKLESILERIFVRLDNKADK
jgi:hypothetical protein